MLIKLISKKIYNFMSRHIKVEPELKDVYIYGIEITVSTSLNVCLYLRVADGWNRTPRYLNYNGYNYTRRDGWAFSVS